MPSAVESPAPARAPPTRAESMVARDIPSAPTRCAGGIVPPMRAWRITRSLGRKIPFSVAATNTQAGDSAPVSARIITSAASVRYTARMKQRMRRPPTRSPSTPNIGAASVPRNWSEPKAVSSRTEPVWTITYQPRMMVSISKAHDANRAAAHWYRKLRTWNAARIRSDLEQLRRGVTQHRGPLRVGEAGRAQDVVHRRARPGVGIVGAHDDLAGTGLGGQVSQGLGGEDDRVVIHLAQVLGRLLLDRGGAADGEDPAALVGAPRVRGQEAAAVRGADLEPREPVEGALEDQVRERGGGLERVADHVVEEPITLEPAGRVQLRVALRMDEDQHPELLGLGPEGVELRVGDLLAVDAASDGRTTKVVLLHAVFQLGRGQIGMLQGDRREGHEAIRMRRARLRELLVLDLANVGYEVAVRLVPVGIDAEGLDVDAVRVHGREALLGRSHQQLRGSARRLDLEVHQRQSL